MIRSRLYALVSVPLFAFLYIATAIGVFFILILAWLKMKRAIHFISQVWAKSIFLMMGKKIKVKGKENINPEMRYILVANHASLFDIVAIMSLYRGITWFGHERLLKVPLFGTILKMTDYVPFKEPNYRNTKRMMEQLEVKSRTQTIAIFPEGTRTLDGRINTFYKGFIHLFRKSDIGILPVTLNGFYNLKPKNRVYINFSSKLEIIVHKPLTRNELINCSDNEIIEIVKSIIESAYI